MKFSKELIRKAHKLTKEIKAEYPEVNYSFQFGICLKCLLSENQISIEEKIENTVNNSIKKYTNKLVSEVSIRNWKNKRIYINIEFENCTSIYAYIDLYDNEIYTREPFKSLLKDANKALISIIRTEKQNIVSQYK